jgi:hypothetical protein
MAFSVALLLWYMCEQKSFWVFDFLIVGSANARAFILSSSKQADH